MEVRMRSTPALLLSALLVVPACQPGGSGADETETPEEEGSAPPLEPLPEVERPPELIDLADPPPATGFTAPVAGPCSMRGTFAGTETESHTLTTVLYDGDQLFMEYSVDVDDPNQVQTTLRTYDAEGRRHLEIQTTEARPRLLNRRRNTYTADDNLVLREEFGAGMGEDFRIAYRYDGDTRQGDLDNNFDGYIDGIIRGRLDPNGELLREVVDIGSDESPDRIVEFDRDGSGEELAQRVYATGGALTSTMTRSFDEHGNLTMSTFRDPDEELIGWVASGFECWEWTAPAEESCGETRARDLGEMFNRVCARSYLTQQTWGSTVPTVTEFYEPVRGTTLIEIGPASYAVDGQDTVDVDQTIARLLELAETMEREGRPDVTYIVAIDPATPVSQVTALFEPMEARRARRIALLFDADVTVSLGPGWDAIEARASDAIAGLPEADADRTEAVRAYLEAETATCGAVLSEYDRIMQNVGHSTCNQLTAEWIPTFMTCECVLDEEQLLAVVAQLHTPDRYQTMWSLRLRADSPLPLAIDGATLWGDALPEIFSADPNRFWIAP